MSVWAFYGRVSGVEQVANNSLPTQREACRQRAFELGATEVLDFIDAGVPGDLDWTDRPALNRLLGLVEAGAVSGFIAHDPDRLARDLGVQLAITELLAKHQVRLEFVTQQYNASPEGMLFYQIRGAVSQFERAKIRERTARGRKKILREGIPANKPGLYGLTFDRATRTWRIEEARAQVVRQLFRWVAEGRRSTWIADQLNAAGVPPLRGVRWWKTTVLSMAGNPTYAGRLFIHRYNREGAHRNRFLPPERRKRGGERPQTDWIEVAVPAIVDPMLWDAAQAARGEQSRRWSGRNSRRHQYLASRLLQCGLCGGAMTGTTTLRGQVPFAYYRCGRGCGMPYLQAPALEASLWQAVRSQLADPERFRQAVALAFAPGRAARTGAPAPPPGQLEAVRADIARLQALIEQGAVREQEVRPAMKALIQREQALTLTLRLPPGPPPVPAPAADPTAELDRWSFAQRLALLRGLVTGIVAHPGGELALTPRAKARLPGWG